MGRSILAVIVGVVAGFVVVVIGELPNGVLYPPPPGFDYYDRVAMSAYIATLPLTAFLIVLAAHAVAAFVAGFVAAWIARRARATHALIVGFLILGGAIANLASFDHPLWFWRAEIAVYLPAAYAGSLLAPRPRRAGIPVSA